MKNLKAIAFLVLAIIILLYITIQSLVAQYQAEKDKARIISNQVTLQDSVTYYRDRLNREAAHVDVMEYTVKELKTILPGIAQDIKDLNIKTSHVQSYSQTEVQQEKEITAHLRDTSIIVNYIYTPAKAFNYTDTWYNVMGIIDSLNINLQIRSTDTITQVVSRGERINPWLWIFSRRKLEQTIQSANPYNKIKYSKYIQIKK